MVYTSRRLSIVSNSLLDGQLWLKRCYTGQVLIILSNHSSADLPRRSRAIVSNGWPLTARQTNLCFDVLVALRWIELFEHDLLFIRINDELLDILREHRKALILLRIGESPGELYVLWVDYHLLPASTANSRARARLQSLSLVECLRSRMMAKVWTQHFELLSWYLSPWVHQDLLRWRAALRCLVKEFREEEASTLRDMIRELQFLGSYVVIELLIVLTSEWELSTQKCI